MKPDRLAKTLLLLFFTFISYSVFSQVDFDQISFDEALEKSAREGKLIFVQLASPSCRDCNDVAEKGLSDKELSQQVNQTFIPLYIDNDHPDRQQIESTYNIPGGFGILFINNEGTLIHRYAGSSTRPQHYREQIDIAISRAGEALKVSDLERAYQSGNRSPGLMEQLLLKKRSLNLNNKDLLDEYVSLLPADSFSSVHTLQFIASMGPELRSTANKTMLRDTAMFNKAWYSMSPAKRSMVNWTIIRHSLNRAILEKNEAYALQVASFARTRYKRNSVSGIKAYAEQLLSFYRRINDTPKFLSIAARHYDLVMNTTNLDSLKSADIALRQKSLDSAKKQVMKTEYGIRVHTTIRYNPLTQRFHWELKEGAWHVYKRAADPALLAKATVWIETALKAFVSPEALDVYARLLYKQHQNEKAIEVENQAIELKKKRGFMTKDFEVALQQMKKGEQLTN